jgi:hypothetical protein
MERELKALPRPIQQSILNQTTVRYPEVALYISENNNLCIQFLNENAIPETLEMLKRSNDIEIRFTKRHLETHNRRTILYRILLCKLDAKIIAT